MKNKKLISAVLLSLFILGAVLFFQNNILDIYSKIFLKLPILEEKLADSLAEQIEKRIITPEPLETQEKNTESFLTKEGVVTWTNIQRNSYGLLP
jgi:hypothetical protein